MTGNSLVHDQNLMMQKTNSEFVKAANSSDAGVEMTTNSSSGPTRFKGLNMDSSSQNNSVVDF